MNVQYFVHILSIVLGYRFEEAALRKQANTGGIDFKGICYEG